MKTTRFGGIGLKIEMARQIRTALKNAKILKGLSGPQRQRLDDTIERLEDICTDNEHPEVTLPVELVIDLLQCISGTQEWFGNMFDDYGRNVD